MSGQTVNEPGIASLACPRDLRDALRNLAGKLSGGLGEGLCGAYVRGSLARGCYRPEVSDVNVLIVTSLRQGFHEIAPVDRALDALAATGPAVHVELATIDQMHADVFPTPVESRRRPTEERLSRPDAASDDFLLHRRDAWEAGVSLTGPPARGLFGPPPWALLAACLNALLPSMISRYRHPVLTLCRTAYAYARRSLCSKVAAAHWALERFPPRYHPMIDAALEAYTGRVRPGRALRQDLLEFQAYCLHAGQKLFAAEAGKTR